MNILLPGLIGDEIKIAIGIRDFIIDRRRKDPVVQSQAGGDALHGRPSGHGMSDHGFNGTHRQSVRMLPEYFLDDFRFFPVEDHGRMGVPADIVNVFRIQMGMGQGKLKGLQGVPGLGAEDHRIIGVVGQATPQNFGVDPRPLFCACSISSRMSVPPPSPSTKPDLRLS